ncbi:MAG: PQQ-like beta-propeller repeat protein, partial [Pirellulales bacterium]|nr:PQQ-like beta-propeller repeat protein [Pirellulales bacterium]
AGGKGTGGSFVSADEKYFYVHTRNKGTRAFKLSDGVKTAFMPSEPVLAGDWIYSAEASGLRPFVRAYNTAEEVVWELPVDGRGDLILAGEKLVAAGDQAITIIGLDQPGRSPRVMETIPLQGVSIQRLIVAGQKLFAVTLGGQLMAFGKHGAKARHHSRPAAEAIEFSEPAAEVAASLLAAGDAEGYAIWYGAWQSPGLKALAAKSPFNQLAVVSSDADDVDRMRRELDRAGIYGQVTAHHCRADAFLAPQYVANMLFVDLDALAPSFAPAQLADLYQSVRPYGGVMYVLTQKEKSSLAKKILAMNLEQAQVNVAEFGVSVKREGALPGSAAWTHQYGSIANTLKSDDRRVKLPLGILWFGGSSNMDVLPRHGHGPPEQVVGGRLFIQGINRLSARDVYTGRVLWKRQFRDLGTYDVYYDDTYEDTPLDPKYNQVHIPGANARGTNYVATADRIYLVEGAVCHAIDPATGKTRREFRMPAGESGEQPNWGYLGVYKNVLIGGVGFADYRQRNDLTFASDKRLKRSRAGFGSKSLDRAASLALIGFDRHSGEELWRVSANHSFWHNGIVAGGDQIYCLDRNPQKVEDALRRRGILRPDGYRIVALDYRTGKTNWEITEGIFGTWLGYSSAHDLLLQAGAKASDRLYDEVDRGMAAYEARDGKLRWKDEQRNYSGPCILHNDLIITNANSYSQSAGAFYLADGKPKLVENPLTGHLQPWRITRAYGCNNIIASENLLTFRSGAAGFYDLNSKSGTGNLGGFKSGCTSNLVVADGVLNAPDYTRTCSCAYQNQTSLGLVHMPDVEMWSVNAAASAESQGQRLSQLGINFGAPGDRRDDDGLLWIEYPVVAGSSPPVSIHLNEEANFFQRHSSTVSGNEAAWILASGVQAVTDIRIDMELASGNGKNVMPQQRYDIQLFFAANPQGELTVFDVWIGERLVAKDVALNPTDRRYDVRRLRDIAIGDQLHIRLQPKMGSPSVSGISIVRQSEP